MQKVSLLVLAAGIGSRYGGLKQIDRLGPSGERIIDYSIYDAIRAGFRKIVFVIRRDIEAEINELLINKIRNYVDVDYVFQDLDNLPEDFKVPQNRIKPWGTGHAVIVAKDKIHEPFAVINSDDFYGYDSYHQIMQYLQYAKPDSNEFFLAGYLLKNTLSEFGAVSRGVCSIDERGYLNGIKEQKKIYKEGNKIFCEEDNVKTELMSETLVSMNFWGFTPMVFDMFEELFKEFLKENINSEKAEFYIPTAIDSLIKQNKCKVKIIPTNSEWFGVTYKEDRQKVVEKIYRLVELGKYPTPLWR